MIRVPMYKPEQGPVDPDRAAAPSTPPANPYLAYAAVLAAGLKGIENGYELPR